jgi:hypothetical protein
MYMGDVLRLPVKMAAYSILQKGILIITLQITIRYADKCRVRLTLHIILMTNTYCPAAGCYDAVEAHKKISPVDGLSMLNNTYVIADF